MKTENRLFMGSCFALITTAFSYSIRAGILVQLGKEMNFTAQQLGFINSMWFLGFPLSMLVGGLVYYSVGPKRIMQFAFFSHSTGVLLTIFSSSYMGLLVSTFLIGLGNGCTEAGCNPMIADSYEGEEMNKKMNRFHMWFPGGTVIGALISKFMTDAGFSWQAQIWTIMIPTIIYAMLFWGQSFPEPKDAETKSLTGNFKAMISPLYIFMFFTMSLTAICEFGPTQWVQIILAESGAQPMVVMAIVFGSMTILRYFGGNLVAKFDQTSVLLGSTIIALIGLFLLSTQTGSMVYFYAVILACGIAFFWPNMIGFIVNYIPKCGALGMSIIGAVGMFSTSLWQPIIGGWIDAANKVEGVTKLETGQAILQRMMIYPSALIVLFTILIFWVKRKGTRS